MEGMNRVIVEESSDVFSDALRYKVYTMNPVSRKNALTHVVVRIRQVPNSLWLLQAVRSGSGSPRAIIDSEVNHY
jgi:hypothetical protein